ncbi:MAG: thioredoxin [Phycisphaerales bacterium]
MPTANVKEFTAGSFDADVLSPDQPVLVDFWAEWCMPCKILGPTIDEIADQFEGKAVVGKVDIDSNQEIAVKFGISAIPTVIIFHKGEVAKKFVGLTNKEDLAAAIDDLV